MSREKDDVVISNTIAKCEDELPMIIKEREKED